MVPQKLFKKIRQLEIRTKGLVNNVFGGEYHSAFKGRGMAFSEVRPYIVGDDVRTIDWNVSARTGEPHVKIFEEEREQTLMLAVDISGSGNFGSKSMLKREMAAEICAVMAFSAIQNNDKVGLLLFSDQVELFVSPQKGRRHVLRLIRDLFAHEAQSTGTNISIALNRILHMLKRRSIVVFVSDFIDVDFDKPLGAVARKHDTIAIRLEDPRDLVLPPIGIVTLRDAETGEMVTVDTKSKKTRKTFEANAQLRRKVVDDVFRRRQVAHIDISTEDGYLDPLIRFFRLRHR